MICKTFLRTYNHYIKKRVDHHKQLRVGKSKFSNHYREQHTHYASCINTMNWNACNVDQNKRQLIKSGIDQTLR